MSDYEFNKQLRWSDKKVAERVAEVASAQLGAVGVERSTEAEDKRGNDWWADVPGRARLGIDVKKRATDWPDVVLETVSVVESRKPGWAVDLLKQTDFVLWMWPSRSLLLSYPQVRAATIAHREEWERLYPQQDRHGEARDSSTDKGRYHTRNVYVPEVVLLDALYPGLQAISRLPSKDVWRALPRRCWTCGSQPVGRYPDGSPSYSCSHPAVAL